MVNKFSCVFFTASIVLGMAASTNQILEPVFDIRNDCFEPNNMCTRGDGDSAYVDSFIRARMALDHIPGLASCVVKNGQVIWSVPYGWANIEDSIPVADTTIFTLMSVSKTPTAVSIMQLWERGLLGLDDDINSFLPFQVVHPFYPDSIMTLRMLMTHTSAINDNWDVIVSLISWGGDSPIPLGQFLQEYLVPGGAYYDPNLNFNDFPPGFQYDYCNVASSLIAYLVEVIQDSFPIYTRDSIFLPLSMSETAWFYADLDTNNIAMPYNWNDTNFVPYGQYGNPIYPAGWLKTSAPQLTRFLTAFMQYGIVDTIRILDSTTVDLMTTIQDSSINPDQGLIWYRKVLFGKRVIWGHRGGWLGIRTFMFYCPAETSGVVVLTNGQAEAYLIADKLFDYARDSGLPLPSAPYIVEVRKNLSDIYLTWNQVTTNTSGNPDTIDHYVIYRDTIPNYIVSATDSIGYCNYAETTFIDVNAMNDMNHYYYLVKAVNIHNKKSKPSNMGFKFNKFFNENPAATDKMRPGIHFIEVEGKITQKLVKIR